MSASIDDILAEVEFCRQRHWVWLEAKGLLAQRQRAALAFGWLIPTTGNRRRLVPTAAGRAALHHSAAIAAPLQERRTS